MDTIIPQKRCYKCPEGQQWHDATPENFGPDKRTTDKLRNCCRSCRHTEYEESLKRNPDLNKDKYQHLLQSPDSLIKHKIRQSVNRKRYYAEASPLLSFLLLTISLMMEKSREKQSLVDLLHTSG